MITMKYEVLADILPFIRLLAGMSYQKKVTYLKGQGFDKLQTLKIIKDTMNLDLKEAKDIVDNFWTNYHFAGDVFIIEDTKYVLCFLGDNIYVLINLLNGKSLTSPKIVLGVVDDEVINYLTNNTKWKK